MASEERPSASATSCQSFGSGMCVTLSASPIAQAQIRGLRTTVIDDGTGRALFRRSVVGQHRRR